MLETCGQTIILFTAIIVMTIISTASYASRYQGKEEKNRGRIPDLRVDYDNDYGIDHQSGWSVTVEGSVLVQFEKHLLVALVKAAWKHRQIKIDMDGE